MTGGVTVSVALCTHNGERFVRQQVESIFAQTVLPTELIVSDDASSDSTLSVVSESIERFRGSAPALSQPVNVVVLTRSTPLGVVGNLEVAIAACTGDLVALSDQDDEWVPNRLETALGLFEARPELSLLYSDADLVSAEGLHLGTTLFGALGVTPRMQQRVHAGDAWHELLHRNIVTGATTAFRRSLADDALPVPEGWLHDEWLAIVAAVTGQVDLVPDRLVRYRQHGENQVGARKLSFGGKARRMLEPGGARSSRLLVRASSLVARLPRLPRVTEVQINEARHKLAHEQVRSALSPHRLRRIGPVLRELGTGRYSAFGRGVLDAARDLLQPLETGR